MGLFSDLISATVKTALTPLAVVKDVVNVAMDEKPNATKKLLKSAGKDLDKAIDKINPENW